MNILFYFHIICFKFVIKYEIFFFEIYIFYEKDNFLMIPQVEFFKWRRGNRRAITFYSEILSELSSGTN